MTSPVLLRSNVEAAKRVFLDRLTTDQQPLENASNHDAGPGDLYVYANVGDSNNFGVGFDCSGWCGVGVATAMYGLAYWVGRGYQRLFATGSFAAWAQASGGAWKQTTQADLVNGSYPLKVMIHQGSGPDGHMAMWLDGWNMESNGDNGLCQAEDEITGVASDYWDTWWVWDGPITEDTTERQPMSYPLGLDYAGGHCAGADLVANNVKFVCRYLSSGGASLPYKQLTADEFADLTANGIGVVFNWETTSDFMLQGQPQGVADAQAALSYIQSLPGIPAGYQPVVYFSCDFDEAPAQDGLVEAYLKGAASVLGGMDYVGIYGAFYICSRAQAAVGVKYIWQTEAWSGGNVTSAVNIMQRNSLGYMTVDGVQCDIDEQHTDDIGAFVPTQPAPAPAPTPVPAPAPVAAGPTYATGTKPGDEADQLSDVFDQELIRWPFLNNNTAAEALGVIGAALKIPGYYDPTAQGVSS